jgi:hypothetical protein
MDDRGTDNRRESGTGQDTPTVCVHVRHRSPIRLTGHSATMSRPVLLSRVGDAPSAPMGAALAGWLRYRSGAVHRPQECAP